MLIVKLLREQNNSHFTIKKYNLIDLSTSHTIMFLIYNKEKIFEYFRQKDPKNLKDENDYYDYLFLEFIEEFEADIEHIPDEYGNELREIVDFAVKEKTGLSNGNIIKCIKSKYKQIFKLADEYNDSGLRDYTLEYLIKYNSGFLDCGVFEYMTKYYTYYVLDHLEELFQIFKKNDNKLMKLLMIDHINRILDMRFSMVCEAIIGIHRRDIVEIAEESARLIYNKIIERYESGEEAFSLQIDLNAAYKTLYYLKLEEARLLIPIINSTEENVSDWVVKDGQELKFDIPIGQYREYLENYEAPLFYKYLALTHDISLVTSLWKSHIDTLSENSQESFVDLVATAQNTNPYFTISKKTSFEVYSGMYSVFLTCWFKNTEFEVVFKDSFKEIIESIFDILDYDITFEELDENIDNFIQIISEAVNENEHGITLFNKIMFVISFLEKLLRLVYISVDSNIFFNKNITLGSIFGKDDSLNPVMLKIIGEHQLRWTRYYLLKDDDEVGLEYRNRIAHLRDINPNEFTLNEFLTVVWIIISTINTIFVNLVNDESLEMYLNDLNQEGRDD